MASIDLKPQVLDLSLYAGDGVDFKLICTDSNNDPVDISGAVKAQIRVDRNEASTPIADFAADMVNAPQGVVELSLTGDQTQLLMADPSVSKDKFQGVWDVEWTPTGKEPRTLCQGKVECVADVTR